MCVFCGCEGWILRKQVMNYANIFFREVKKSEHRVKNI